MTDGNPALCEALDGDAKPAPLEEGNIETERIPRQKNCSSVNDCLALKYSDFCSFY